MADEFDPYRKWLGIPEGSRPPTHYQLLGISPDEQDPTVIDASVIRQSAYVRNFQNGKHADQATKLLNEIASAQACLNDRAKRAQYDAELKKRQAPPQPSNAASLAQGGPSATPAPRLASTAPPRATTPVPPKRQIPIAPSIPYAMRPPPPRRGAATSTGHSQPSFGRKRKPSALIWQAPLVAVVCAAIVVLILVLPRQQSDLKRNGQPDAPAVEPRSEPVARASSQGYGKGGAIPPPSATPPKSVLRTDLPKSLDSTPVAKSIETPSPTDKQTVGPTPSNPPQPATVPFDAAQAKQFQDVWARHLGHLVVETNSIGMKLVLVPPGKFLMGTVGNGGRDDEKPPHEVTLTRSYYVSDREVTVAQFRLCIDDAAYPIMEKPQRWQDDFQKYKQFSPEPDCPANTVTWFEAVLYCNWLSGKEGRKPAYGRTGEKQKSKLDGKDIECDVWHCDFSADGYRLPTEAEWEFASRAGSSGAYCFGSDAARLGEYASFPGNANGRMWPAGERLPNAWGLFDMHGNAWEWCWDWQGPYGGGPQNDPVGPDAGVSRVIRGGAFGYGGASECRCAYRDGNRPAYHENGYGFRVCCRPRSPAAAPVDLLKLIDPERDAVVGEWRLNGSVLWSPDKTPYARLQVPYDVPEEYAVTMMAEPEGALNKDTALRIGLVGGDSQFQFALQHQAKSGVAVLDNDGWGRGEATFAGNEFKPGVQNTIVCIVRKTGVDIAIDGRLVVEWRGAFGRLSLNKELRVPNVRHLFVGAEGSFKIHKLVLTPLPPDDPATKPKSASRRRDTERRLPLPSGAPLGAARKQVETQHGKDFKTAKNLAQRLAVVRAMYDSARSARDDPFARYALLDEARERAVNLGDAATACQTIEDLGRAFDVDFLALKAEALRGVMEKARLPQQVATVAMLALSLVDRAARADRYELADQFAAVAAAAARKIEHPGLLSAANARASALRARMRPHEVFQNALKELKSAADDPKANLTVGRFRCWYQGDWERGLPALVKSSDRELAMVAELELASLADPVKALALADAWQAAGEKRTGAEQLEYRQQAKCWLYRARGGAPVDAGLAARLAQVPGYSPSRLEVGLAALLFEGANFELERIRRTDWQIDSNFGWGGPHPAVPVDNFSIRWTGWLVPPMAGRYVLATSSDDSVRVRIDDQLVIDHWGRGAGVESHEVELTEAPHALVVEYNEYGATAAVLLRWSIKDLSSEHVVPAEALFSDPGE